MRYTREHEQIAKNARLRASRGLMREERAQRERARRDVLKRRMIEYLGGACARCNRTLEEVSHPAAFDFHHRDWRSKRFKFAGNYGRQWEVLRAELDKCQLVCACCHRIIEATLEDPGRPRGRPPLSSTRSQVADGGDPLQVVQESALRSVARTAASRVALARDQMDLFNTIG